MPQETRILTSKLRQEYNQPGMGQIPSCPVGPDTDDSSNFIGWPSVNYNQESKKDDSLSVPKTDQVKYIFVAVPVVNTGALKGNSDPMDHLAVARTMFEERLKRNESERLRNPENLRVLETFKKSILYPISTLLMEFHAPRDWKTCKKCGAFFDTHCCIMSHWQKEFDDVAYNYLNVIITETIS